MDKNQEPIYLDHNATTPVHPGVVEAMLPYLREHFGNPSSGHVYGQRARHAVERAREQVASLLFCQPEESVFTSGGTEANNLAIRGVPARQGVPIVGSTRAEMMLRSEFANPNQRSWLSPGKR